MNSSKLNASASSRAGRSGFCRRMGNRKLLGEVAGLPAGDPFREHAQHRAAQHVCHGPRSADTLGDTADELVILHNGLLGQKLGLPACSHGGPARAVR
jgi:hypothetical protein